MSKQYSNIEDLFSGEFKQFELNPGRDVLRKLRFKLWMADFFSLNFRKFNIAYTTIITGAAVLTPFMINNNPTNNEITATSSITENINEEKTIEQNTTTESFENRIRNQNITNENIETSNVEQAVKNAKHSIAEANFTLDNIKGCAPLLVKFKNQSKNAKSYLWEFGNGDISVKKNPTYTFTEAGNYTVTLTAQSKDGSNITFTKDITVLPSPIAEFNIDIDESDIKTRKIVFRNNSKDASKYYWEFGDKKSAEDEQPNHVYSDYKPYKVKLTTISKDGCSDTAVLVNKFIEKNYALSFPNSFHPSAGGPGNSGYYGSMGENSSIFFPNNNGASEYSLRIKTPHGIEVFNTNNIEQGWNGYIRGRIAPAGVYSYTAKGTYPNGQSFEINGQVKVVVQNVYDYYQ